MNRRPRVVVVGGGFGGLAAARALARADTEVLLFDRHNHHLFQPLLYQVATAALSPGHIAAPIRKILRRQRNCEVVMAEVTGVELERSAVVLEDREYVFDYLVLAAGARTNYFGHDDWAKYAPGLKTIDEAVDVRCRFLLAFEQAEIETDVAARRAALTFAIVGAGPTGVEMAGAIAEISRKTLPGDFRRLDTRDVRVILIDASDHVLSGFAPGLAERAERDLRSIGVELMLSTTVIDVDASGLTLEDADGKRRIETPNVFWAAGVRAVEMGKTLGVECDRTGRVVVGEDLSIPGHANVFVIGDLARVDDARTGQPVPGVAQGALQMGRFAGTTIAAEITAASADVEAPRRRAFVYRDRGTLATIGRNRAVADLGRFRIGGTLAFALWALVHILFLIDFRRRVTTLAEWMWMYFFHERGVRLITGEKRVPKPIKPPPDPRGARGDP